MLTQVLHAPTAKARILCAMARCLKASNAIGTDSVACLQTSCHGAQYPCFGSRGVEHLREHCGSLSYRWFCSAQTPVKDGRSTDLQHLPWSISVWDACLP